MYSDTTIIFDLDGTICRIKAENEKYEDLMPNQAIVDKMRAYAMAGVKIVIYTSRNMRTYDGDLKQIEANTVPLIKTWLKKWNIPCDELIIGKPWAGERGIYVDDRAVRPKEFLENNLDELMGICQSASMGREEDK